MDLGFDGGHISWGAGPRHGDQGKQTQQELIFARKEEKAPAKGFGNQQKMGNYGRLLDLILLHVVFGGLLHFGVLTHFCGYCCKI